MDKKSEAVYAKIFLSIILIVLIAIAGCGATTGNAVVVRTGVINSHKDDTPKCDIIWKCERGERYRINEDCKKDSITICREGCSNILAGECIPTNKTLTKEFYREKNDAGRVLDMPQLYVTEEPAVALLRANQMVQVWFPDDTWSILRAVNVSYNKKEAVFTLDDEFLVPLTTNGITHSNGDFVKVLNFSPPQIGKQDGVTVSIGRVLNVSAPFQLKTKTFK